MKKSFMKFNINYMKTFVNIERLEFEVFQTLTD